jgi:hypothetical protein
MGMFPCGFKQVAGTLWMSDSARGSGRYRMKCFRIVMAGLVPAIHDLARCAKNVDAGLRRAEAASAAQAGQARA